MLARTSAICALTALLPFAALAATPPAIAGHARALAQTEALSSTAPWWERLVLTLGDEGETRTCTYQTSLIPGETKACEVTGATAGADEASTEGLPEQLTHLTFERRFSPDAAMDEGEVAAGDTLIGKSVLVLAIDAQGNVRGCRVVATGGMKPDYGCKEAAAEKFEASATNAPVATRVSTLTILVYAHDENQV